MRFDWLRLRFAFEALERVDFPPFMAANVLRGALGVISRRLACRPDCESATTCPHRLECLYARVFEPAPRAGVPSGLADLPRPFVFRARHLDACTIHAAGGFHFDLHLFSKDPAIRAHLARTFGVLEQHGLGPARAKVRLLEVTDEPHSVALTSDPPVERITVHFVTPTEIKAGGRLVLEPEFPALFGRVRDRISTLRMLYGERPLILDFAGLGERAATIRMTSWNLHAQQLASRYSTRTRRTHPLGGFTGTAVYEGALGEFTPWLRASEAAGVGRQAVWGKGEISVSQ
jgi:hypothetical protein